MGKRNQQRLTGLTDGERVEAAKQRQQKEHEREVERAAKVLAALFGPRLRASRQSK